MAALTTRFVVQNYLDFFSNVTIKNGTGGGAPARIEDPSYVMENVLNPDRYSQWRVPAGAHNDVFLDLDLGTNRSIGYMGVHGYSGDGSGLSFPTQCRILYKTAAQGYDGSFSTAVGPGAVSLGAQPRDSGTPVAPVVLARYIRFWFESTLGRPFGVGRPWLAPSPIDLGVAQAAGTGDARQRTGTTLRAPFGGRRRTTTGPQRREFALQFPSIPHALCTTLFTTVGAVETPVLYLSPFGETFEVDLTEDRIEREYVFGAGAALDLWNVTLPLEQLP